MRQLALWDRVIFVDWHGVLSRDPFWTSIRESSTHPLRPQLDAKLGEIFANDHIAHDWMRGILSSEEVIANLGIWLDRRFRDDFLARRLDIDCAKMRVNVELFEVLRGLRSRAIIVLATDNMDCFARTFDIVRNRRRRPTFKSGTLTDWAVICDDIICSSDVGTLKADDPKSFFGGWLADCGLAFSNSLLIDDRADNCEAFRGQGGSTIQWKMGKNDISEVVESVGHWLDHPVSGCIQGRGVAADLLARRVAVM
jgi:FMN phosphatase YigB (HAD superfamily)